MKRANTPVIGDGSAFSSNPVHTAHRDDASLQLLPLATLPTAAASSKHRKKRVAQVISLCFYLISWVANGEMLQTISNGSDKHTNDSRRMPAYDKPFAITWFSYNYMMLGMVLIMTPTIKRRSSSLFTYMQRDWAGRLGLPRAMAVCALFAFALQFLNVLLVVGLGCVSVSLSNAVYQLQTIFTVGLSVWCLHDQFVMAEACGIVLSIVGVSVIVIPPLLWAEDEEESESTSCSNIWGGVLATLLSAALGGGYLVAWRAFEEARCPDTGTNTGLEGLVDTQLTLAMMGVCNLTLCWIILPVVHGTGVEVLAWPPSWWMLHWNGMIEYAFDASCAVAIYMTSPVVVAIVSPLTIPLAMWADYYLLGKTSSLGNNGGGRVWHNLLGVVIILMGVILMEIKPDLSQWMPSKTRLLVQKAGGGSGTPGDKEEQEMSSLLDKGEGAEKKV
ncbi:EamA-like transporter family [Seminavis robusta]|uniref:EamA-like transporter family n=1 Tax=Seminavis robusta TaxID=568900 RepID=A0A9N8HA45_9STRA|nr:EamA-like transporter family [Seminavis robusta]|eukprot:Sro136_g064030.1 EamA-like transporter family (445) ;mRNA; f:32815-34149